MSLKVNQSLNIVPYLCWPLCLSVPFSQKDGIFLTAEAVTWGRWSQEDMLLEWLGIHIVCFLRWKRFQTKTQWIPAYYAHTQMCTHSEYWCLCLCMYLQLPLSYIHRITMLLVNAPLSHNVGKKEWNILGICQYFALFIHTYSISHALNSLIQKIGALVPVWWFIKIVLQILAVFYFSL